jgi:hypothetical protein
VTDAFEHLPADGMWFFSKGSGMVDSISPQSRRQKTTLGQLLLGFLCCVVFPAFVTAIVPASWVHFQRTGNRVSATTKTCVFFVIPWKVQHVDRVVGIDDHFIQGTLSTRRSGESQRHQTRSEDESFLEIHGETDSAEVPVSPFSIKGVVEKSKHFLESSDEPEMKFFVIANWKFGLLAGGLVSLLTALYLVGLLMLILQSIAALMRRAVVPAQ